MASGVSCPRPQRPTRPDSLSDEWQTAVSVLRLLFLTHAKHGASEIGPSSKQMINRAFRVSPLTSVLLLTATNRGPLGSKGLKTF